MKRYLAESLLVALSAGVGWWCLYLSLETRRPAAWRALYLIFGLCLILSGFYLAVF